MSGSNRSSILKGVDLREYEDIHFTDEPEKEKRHTDREFYAGLPPPSYFQIQDQPGALPPPPQSSPPSRGGCWGRTRRLSRKSWVCIILLFLVLVLTGTLIGVVVVLNKATAQSNSTTMATVTMSSSPSSTTSSQPPSTATTVDVVTATSMVTIVPTLVTLPSRSSSTHSSKDAPAFQTPVAANPPNNGNSFQTPVAAAPAKASLHSSEATRTEQSSASHAAVAQTDNPTFLFPAIVGGRCVR